VIERGIYAATQGTRLESAAEIDRLARDGADVVGMTGMPEAALAREISLEYATIAVVANFAAGRGESRRAVPLERIGAVLDEAMGRVRRIIYKLCEPA
jgi:5'-methylthioadenosine phosphorylase